MEAQSQFVRGNSSSGAPLQRLRFDVQQQTSDRVETQPWQYKGEGKGGSLGVSVGSSRIVAADAGNAHALEKGIPDAPHAFTAEDVQDMFDTGYFRFPERPFWDGKNIWQVKKGTHCLWKNVPIGKRVGWSTKTELFHGEVHGWQGDEVILI